MHAGTNGPSGAGLFERILKPLGLATSDVAFTDAVPWFFIKPGAGGQGHAIAERFAPIARLLDIHEGTLPVRPSPKQLPQLAASPARRDSLRHELCDAHAPLVITLGQEALDAVIAAADEVHGVPRKLTPDSYRTTGHSHSGRTLLSAVAPRPPRLPPSDQARGLARGVRRLGSATAHEQNPMISGHG